MSIATAKGPHFVNINEAFCAATGYRIEDVIGRSAAELGLWVDKVARTRFERDLTKVGQVQAVETRL